MDVAVWLRSLGLEQYEAAFRENATDVSVLPDLTDQDLEKLGVLLGHRRNYSARLQTSKQLRKLYRVRSARYWPLNGSPRGHRRTPPSDGDVLRQITLKSLSFPR
jgi:SAM domain (Sterile alpha motif)